MSSPVTGSPGGSWLHSFEEDEGGVQVYRRADFAFPPSRRGRERLEFGMPGELRLGTPGPDDRTRFVAGGSAATGPNRYRVGDQEVEVVEAGPDLLKVRFV